LNTGLDRGSLEGIAEAYLEALVAGNPSAAPLTTDAVFAENDQRLPLGAASWATIDGLGHYRHVFCDFEAETVGVIANITENGIGAVVILRLKLQDRFIKEVEQFVIRDAGAHERYEQLARPEEIWFEPIPPQLRQTREALEAAAWMYFQALYRNDGGGIYPFTDDCQRLEHARPSVNRPSNESYGHADSTVDFVTLKAKQQYSLGMMGYISGVRDRRVLAVDTERGAILSSCCFDFDGMTRQINLTGGGVFEIPPYFRTPRTHHMNEAFKVQNGSYRYIEMMLLEVPFGTRPAWRKEPTSTQEIVSARPPVPKLPAMDRALLIGLVDVFLDAIVRCCPCDLPLADNVEYTENGVRVELGDGLWKSISGRGGYCVYLADPATGQAGYYGNFDENGRFALIAVRLRVAGGLLTEIEVVIARPEQANEWGKLSAATHSMFIAPLLADVNPAGFAEPDPRLLRAPSACDSCEDLLSIVDRYYEGLRNRRSATVDFAESCVRRENGVAATDNSSGPIVDAKHPDFSVFSGSCASQLELGYLASLSRVRRRPWVVDSEAGLLLDLALFDYSGAVQSVAIAGVGEVAAAPSFAAPCTDIHAELFKIDGRKIACIEAAVRRVPYGQASPWDEPLEIQGLSR
jgi:hypothetical protein